MTVILNLKDMPMKATACGSCQGSSSDNTVRTEARTPIQEQNRIDQTVIGTTALTAA